MQVMGLVVLFWIVSTSVFSTSCSSGNLPSQETENMKSEVPVPKSPLDPSPSSIIPSRGDWRIDKQKFPSKVDLKKVVRVPSSQIVFAASSDGRLFRTDPASGTWTQISDVLDTSFVDIAFLSESIGVAIVRDNVPLYKTDAEYRLMETEDGGVNWSTTFSRRAPMLTKLAAGHGVVIAVGGTWDFEPTGDNNHFVLLSLDLGKSWEDISGRLNRASPKMGDRVLDYSTAVDISGNGEVYVLSIHGLVYQGAPDVSEFHLVADFRDLRDQTGFYQLRITDNGSIWASGGAMSMEGYWGFIANASGDTAMSHRLDRHYFSDILVNSDDSIIAAGSIIRPPDYKGPEDMIAGGIFFSENQGKDWSIVYKSSRSSEFTSILQLSNSDFLIVGKKGELVRLTKKV